MVDPVPRSRRGGVALAAAAVMFLLYPAVRPWEDESTVVGATAAMSSPAWVASHLFAMVGFILVPLGLLALRGVLAGDRTGRVAAAGVVVFWVGAGLTLPYYGAEDFGLNAIARRAAGNPGVDLLGLVEAVRFGPAQITVFLLGLVLLAVGAVMVAVAVWSSGTLPRASGILFALGFVMFLPQFFAPPALRIGHGVLLAAGLLWLAVILWRAATRLPTPADANGRGMKFARP
ncbi:MAG TPA: hypothetical protein VGJ95_03895 [Pseudonocardiaceae bacterium]